MIETMSKIHSSKMRLHGAPAVLKLPLCVSLRKGKPATVLASRIYHKSKADLDSQMVVGKG